MDGLAQGFPGQQLFLCQTDWHRLIIILEIIFFLFLTFLLISQETRGWPQSWTNSICLTHKQRCNMGWGKSKTNLEVLPASGRHLTPWQSPSLTYQHHCIWSRFSSPSPITRLGSTTHSSFALSPQMNTIPQKLRYRSKMATWEGKKRIIGKPPFCVQIINHSM